MKAIELTLAGESETYTTEKPRPKGTNIVSADRLVVLFANDNVAQIRVVGTQVGFVCWVLRSAPGVEESEEKCVYPVAKSWIMNAPNHREVLPILQEMVTTEE